MTKLFALAALALPAMVAAAPMPTGAWPRYNGYAQPFAAPRVVKSGEVFDGGMKVYERSNIDCTGSKERGKEAAVFWVEPGGTLKNVIIGKKQAEGVHCEQGGCNIENVWWDAVCEDALSIKAGSASSVSRVIGGGARNAGDKVIQMNGFGTVVIDGFYVENFGKLFRTCGNCGYTAQRKVSVSNVYAVNPKTALVMVNRNYNDVATLSNIKIKSAKSTFPKAACVTAVAVPKGQEPDKKLDQFGPDGKSCVYPASTIQMV